MIDGPTVEERIVRLVRAGAPLFEWRCTPADFEALVIGRLYSEGVIDNADDAANLRITEESAETVIVLPPSLSALPQKRARQPAGEIPSAAVFAELFKALFAGVDERHASGGMHAAALVREERIVFQAEDVGRHNAVDKVVGQALLAGADIAAHGMLVTSRVSGEIARKAANSMTSWLASRSIPTTLAVNIARLARMPIIGRAASKNSFVYQ